MGLRATIQRQLGRAFDTTLVDAVTAFTLYRTENGNYNTRSGTLDSVQARSGSGRGAFTDYTVSEIDNLGIKPTDVKVICLANELPFDPLPDDLIITANCAEYKVINSESDPAKASFEIQCRRGASV